MSLRNAETQGTSSLGQGWTDLVPHTSGLQLTAGQQLNTNISSVDPCFHALRLSNTASVLATAVPFMGQAILPDQIFCLGFTLKISISQQKAPETERIVFVFPQTFTWAAEYLQRELVFTPEALDWEGPKVLTEHFYFYSVVCQNISWMTIYTKGKTNRQYEIANLSHDTCNTRQCPLMDILQITFKMALLQHKKKIRSDAIKKKKLLWSLGCSEPHSLKTFLLCI